MRARRMVCEVEGGLDGAVGKGRGAAEAPVVGIHQSRVVHRPTGSRRSRPAPRACGWYGGPVEVWGSCRSRSPDRRAPGEAKLTRRIRRDLLTQTSCAGRKSAEAIRGARAQGRYMRSMRASGRPGQARGRGVKLLSAGFVAGRWRRPRGASGSGGSPADRRAVVVARQKRGRSGVRRRGLQRRWPAASWRLTTMSSPPALEALRAPTGVPARGHSAR